MTVLTNSEEAKERFYSDSKEIIKNVAITDKMAIAGDFNARVGTEAKHWPSVTGTQGTGKCNSNGEIFLTFCSECGLFITNTVFKHIHYRHTTWMHPISKHWHLLDFFITRQKDLNNILDTKVIRCADCGTGHHMVRSSLHGEKTKKENQRDPKI